MSNQAPTNDASAWGFNRFSIGPWVYGLIHFLMGSFLLWLVKTHADQVFEKGTVPLWFVGLGESAWLLLGVFWGSYGWDRFKAELQGPRTERHFVVSLSGTSWVFLAVAATSFLLQAYEDGGFPKQGLYYLLLFSACLLVGLVAFFVHRGRTGAETQGGKR